LVGVETIAVIAFDGISPFHLSVPCLVFGEDHHHDAMPRYRLRVCAVTPGRLSTNAGFAIEVPLGLGVLRHADIVIVPSWIHHAPVPLPLQRALQAAHRRGARIVGLCLGAFVLAEAGLLDGRPATTHWIVVQEFAQRFPQVQLRPEVLYVDDGSVVTSAGTAAGIDCCLHLVRQRHGLEVANRAARRMVVAPHRQGGQAQYIEQPLPEAREQDRLSALLEWLLQHVAEDHTLDSLSARALMSRRTFTRRFREATGTTPLQWLKAQRLALAQRLLEGSPRSIDAVALDAGYGSALSLRQHFAAALQTSPSAYRRQFRELA
jgi:transcriptional regulator GlxA family with amidase domain